MKTIKTAPGINSKIPVIFITMAILIIAACSKSNNNNPSTTTTSSNVAVINASPSAALYSVYSDTANIYPGNTIAYGNATGISGGSPYEVITAGNHAIKLSANGTSYPLDTTFNFSANKYYSVFAYDTAVGSGSLKTLILNDNLTPPASGQSEVRFLNLSPNSLSLNAGLINADTALKDTMSFSNIAYVGSPEINIDSLSSFKTITPGTYTVSLNSANFPSLVLYSNSITFAAGKIYTLYAKGYVNGTNGADSIGIGTIQNY